MMLLMLLACQNDAPNWLSSMFHINGSRESNILPKPGMLDAVENAVIALSYDVPYDVYQRYRS